MDYLINGIMIYIAYWLYINMSSLEEIMVAKMKQTFPRSGANPKWIKARKKWRYWINMEFKIS